MGPIKPAPNCIGTEHLGATILVDPTETDIFSVIFSVRTVISQIFHTHPVAYSMTMAQVPLIIHPINIPQRVFGKVSGTYNCLPASESTVEIQIIFIIRIVQSKVIHSSHIIGSFNLISIPSGNQVTHSTGANT